VKFVLGFMVGHGSLGVPVWARNVLLLIFLAVVPLIAMITAIFPVFILTMLVGIAVMVALLTTPLQVI